MLIVNWLMATVCSFLIQRWSTDYAWMRKLHAFSIAQDGTIIGVDAADGNSYSWLKLGVVKVVNPAVLRKLAATCIG